MRRGQLEDRRGKAVRRISNHFMGRLAPVLASRGGDVARLRMVVQTDWHASY